MSKAVSITKVQTGDRTVNQLQQNISNAFNQFQQQVSSNPLNTSVTVTASLTTSPTKISHSLGQVPTGFLISDINAAATVFRNAWDINSITLTASAPCKVSVLIF